MRQRRALVSAALALPLLALAACMHWPIADPNDISLKGRVLVEWWREDRFIYRRTNDPIVFKASFMNTPIKPEDMFTDGGSVPRVFWSIPGLSPWGLGPAYILHDWIFEVHRCNRDAPPEVKAITFEQSAQILEEVGQALIAAGLIDHDLLPQIVWAVRTRYARTLWNTPGTAESCARPPSLRAMTAQERKQVRTVVDFVIPPPTR